MDRFPIESYLVPDVAPAVDPTLTAVVATLAGGLPQTLELDRDVSLVLIVPSGLAVQWRDADPSALVSSSTEQLAPSAGHGDAPVGAVDRAAPRLVVQRSGTPVASVPLVAGTTRAVPDTGDDGELIELSIVDWEIHAGSLLGPGDFGSRLQLAWRRADRGTATFEPPATNAQLLSRLEPGDRMESRA